jgi:hypothetical protein
LANLVGGSAGGLRVEALGAAGSVLGAVNYLAAREGLNIPALPSVWAARALLAVARPGFRPLGTVVTFEEAATSLRGQGFEVLVELSAAPGRGG